MAVSRAEIRRLCALVRLDLSAAEIDGLQQDLAGILAYLKLLEQVSGAAETCGRPIAGLGGALRADEVRGGLDAAEALRGAPEVEGAYFAVPKVVELTFKESGTEAPGGGTGEAKGAESDTRDD